jgi:hypothetical protein
VRFGEATTARWETGADDGGAWGIVLWRDDRFVIFVALFPIVASRYIRRL